MKRKGTVRPLPVRRITQLVRELPAVCSVLQAVRTVPLPRMGLPIGCLASPCDRSPMLSDPRRSGTSLDRFDHTLYSGTYGLPTHHPRTCHNVRRCRIWPVNEFGCVCRGLTGCLLCSIHATAEGMARQCRGSQPTVGAGQAQSRLRRQVAEAAGGSGIQRIASTFIAGLGCALFEWALVVISSRIERERQQRHADEFGEHMSPLTRSPPWLQFARSWLLP